MAPRKAQAKKEISLLPEGHEEQSVPQEEHRWLQKLVGDWVSEGEATMAPGQPPMKFKGTEKVRPIGDLWILAEGHGEMPGGGPAVMLLTLGFDPRTNRYVGTWIGSMMTHLWVYDGEIDAAGKILTLNAEGPDMSSGGKMTRFKDVIEVRNNDHRILTSHIMGNDGNWRHFMTAHYRRKK